VADPKKHSDTRLLELEDLSEPVRGADFPLDTRGLSIDSEDTFNPYARAPDAARRSAGSRTDLRRLSAWIKMMRQLEGQRLRNQTEDED
jgi:hypothetical protein